MALAHGAENDEFPWFKSSYSGGSGSDCVEVAFRGQTASVRDSKARLRGQLTVPSGVFAAFIEDLKGQAEKSSRL